MINQKVWARRVEDMSSSIYKESAAAHRAFRGERFLYRADRYARIIMIGLSILSMAALIFKY